MLASTVFVILINISNVPTIIVTTTMVVVIILVVFCGILVTIVLVAIFNAIVNTIGIDIRGQNV